MERPFPFPINLDNQQTLPGFSLPVVVIDKVALFGRLISQMVLNLHGSESTEPSEADRDIAGGSLPQPKLITFRVAASRRSLGLRPIGIPLSSSAISVSTAIAGEHSNSL
jgi:hypothetical protein